MSLPLNEDVIVHDPVGCPLCGDTGYYGRIGVYEIMEISPRLRQIITARGSTEEIKRAALEEGMHTLHRSAVEYVLDGVTSIPEMLKVSFEA